jgi:hypothetical protein
MFWIGFVRNCPNRLLTFSYHSHILEIEKVNTVDDGYREISRLCGSRRSKSSVSQVGGG